MSFSTEDLGGGTSVHLIRDSSIAGVMANDSAAALPPEKTSLSIAKAMQAARRTRVWPSQISCWSAS